MWSAINRGVRVEHLPLVFGSASGRAVFNWPWKLVRKGDDGKHQLYNILEDPYEQKTLAQVKPEILANLETVLGDMPNVSTRRTINESAAKSNGRKTRKSRGTNINYEARTKETRSPWAEGAVRGDK